MSLGKRRNAVVMVGETGAGKTTLANTEIDNYPVERGMVTILDTMYEKALRKYAEIPLAKMHLQNSGKYRVTSKDWHKFVDQCNVMYAEKSTKKGLVYFDDADLISQQEYKPLSHLMGGVRHKNLDVMLCFHQLWRVPPYIMDNSQILIIKKTGESIDKGDINKFKHGDRIYEAFMEVETSPDPYYTKTVVLYGFKG